MGLVVGPAATPAQYEAAREIFRRYARFLGLDLEYRGFTDELATLDRMYGPPRGCLLLARKGEEFVGAVGLREFEPGVAEVSGRRLHGVPPLLPGRPRNVGPGRGAERDGRARGRPGMSFATVVNCMDGRVQLPVIRYLQGRFGVEHVDSVTEAGPCRILAENDPPELCRSILSRVEISVRKHRSRGIAVVAHFDCAGNPAPRDDQVGQVREAVQRLRERFAGVETIGLWVGEDWRVREIPAGEGR